MGGRKRKLPAALTTEHNPPNMYAPTPFVPMPPDYDQSMELRKLMTSSAQGYKGDEEVSDVERTGAVHHGGLSTTGGAAAAVGYGVSSATGGAAGASGGGAAMENGYGGGGKTGEAAAAGLYGGRGTAGGAAAAAAGGGSVAGCGAAMEGAVGAASAGGFVGIGGIGMAAGGVSGGGGGYRGSGMAGEGAAPRAYGGSGGAVAFPMSGGQHGSQYGLGAGYINGPAAVYVGGLAPPCAPPPSVPGSVQEQNGRAYVAPRFRGNNYSTVPSFGFDSHHASSMPNGGLYSSGFSTVSARLAPTVAAPPVLADVANLSSSVCPAGLPTVAGAAGAVVGSQPGEAPIGSQAPSPSPYMQMHTQMPAPGPYSQAVAAMPRTLQPTMPTSPGVGVGTSGDLVDDLDEVTPVALGPFQGPCEPPPPPEHLAPVLRMASISAPPPPPPTPPPPPPAAAAAVASAATETRHVISKGRRSRRGGADTQSTKRKATTNFKAGGKKASTSTPSVIEGAGALLNMTPIDVDVQLSGQPEGRSIVIREGELKSVVQSAMAPLQAHIDMACKDIKEIMGSMKEVRQVLDAQGHAVDRMASGMTVANSNKANAGDANERRTKKEEVKARVNSVRKAKLLVAKKNYKHMDAARAVFNKNMKEDMGMATVSSRVYPSGGVSYEETVRAIMEVHNMNDKEANDYALSVRQFPKRDKAKVKESRVSALILSSKSPFGQQLKTIVLGAWCHISGVKLPAKRQRKKKDAGVAAKAPGIGKSGGSQRASTSAKGVSHGELDDATAHTAVLETDKEKRATAAAKWLIDEAYSKSGGGFKGLMAAVEAQLKFLGVPQRIIKPRKTGEQHREYNCCCMGLLALPAAIIRDYLEKEAGKRSRRRRGVSDGMYEQFSAELKRVHSWLPRDGKVNGGLLLTDGASKDRCKFEAESASSAAKARLLDSENKTSSMAGVASEDGSQLEEEEFDLDELQLEHIAGRLGGDGADAGDDGEEESGVDEDTADDDGSDGGDTDEDGSAANEEGEGGDSA